MNKDNLDQAMNHEAQHLEPTIPPNTGSEPGNPATSQVLIRCTQHDRERWKQAAQTHGQTLSDYIRQALNEATAATLDCPHPINQRRYYPWAEFCLQCGQRLRG